MPGVARLSASSSVSESELTLRHCSLVENAEIVESIDFDYSCRDKKVGLSLKSADFTFLVSTIPTLTRVGSEC